MLKNPDTKLHILSAPGHIIIMIINPTNNTKQKKKKKKIKRNTPKVNSGEEDYG